MRQADPSGAGGLLVRLEARRRRRAGRLLLLGLHEGLVVEALEHVERVSEEFLRLALVGDLVNAALAAFGRALFLRRNRSDRDEKCYKKSAYHILEVLVLELTVLAGTLQLHLHLRDLGLQRGDLLGEGVDRGREVRDLGLHLLDVALLHLLGHLVLVERLNAEVLHLDVVSLLLLQVSDL